MHIQIINFNLTATGRVPRFTLPSHPQVATDASESIVGSREAFFPKSGAISCAVFHRERLSAGHVVAGPAIIEQMDATTLILEGQRCKVDSFLNLVIEETKP